MSNNHPIVAQPWQLKPNLGAVLVPLLPEPEFSGSFWSWSPTLLTVLKVWADGLPFSDYDLLDWQVGDRIYLQEPWYEMSDGYIVSSLHPCPDDAEDWREAEDMPPEAARFWYEITAVEVTQAKALDMPTLIASKLTCWGDPSEDPRLLEKEVAYNWNKCNPEHPYHGDRFVVVLRLRACSLEFR